MGRPLCAYPRRPPPHGKPPECGKKLREMRKETSRYAHIKLRQGRCLIRQGLCLIRQSPCFIFISAKGHFFNRIRRLFYFGREGGRLRNGVGKLCHRKQICREKKEIENCRSPAFPCLGVRRIVLAHYYVMAQAVVIFKCTKRPIVQDTQGYSKYFERQGDEQTAKRHT